MLPSCFDYIFVHLGQKVRLRAELSPKFWSTLGPNLARTRPEKPGPTYNSGVVLLFSLKVTLEQNASQLHIFIWTRRTFYFFIGTKFIDCYVKKCIIYDLYVGIVTTLCITHKFANISASTLRYSNPFMTKQILSVRIIHFVSFLSELKKVKAQ